MSLSRIQQELSRQNSNRKVRVCSVQPRRVQSLIEPFRSLLWSLLGRRYFLLRRYAVVQSLPFRHEQGAKRWIKVRHRQHACADGITKEYAGALLGVSIVAQVSVNFIFLPSANPFASRLVRHTDRSSTELPRSSMRTISIVDGRSRTRISRQTTNGSSTHRSHREYTSSRRMEKDSVPPLKNPIKLRSTLPPVLEARGSLVFGRCDSRMTLSRLWRVERTVRAISSFSRCCADLRVEIAGQLALYDVESRTTKLRVKAHTEDVNAVAFADTASSNILLSGSDDSLLKVWDIRSVSPRCATASFH